jgi:hypothetical protein
MSELARGRYRISKRPIFPVAQEKEYLMAYRFAAMLSLSFSLACGPSLLLPGGELSGTLSAPPNDWGWTEDVSTIQLETRPEDPYSVNIWVVGIRDKLYVHAGENLSNWVENMEDDPSVRVLIDGKIYELTAYRVEDQAEFDAFSDVYEKKYDSRPRNENVNEAYLFQLWAS